MVGRQDATVEILRPRKARAQDDIVLVLKCEFEVESKPAPLRAKGAAPEVKSEE